MIYHVPKNQTGFTLVETLVAMTILLIVITGPMTIIMSTARSTSYASEQVQAFFLAQEGLELVQKVRDEYLLAAYANADPASETPWEDFASDSLLDGSNCFLTSGCGLYFNTANDPAIEGGFLHAVACNSNSGTGCRLYLDDSGDKRVAYTHDTAFTATPFTRKIQITPVGSDQVKVVSTVTWRTGFFKDNQVVKTETYLFNTYDY